MDFSNILSMTISSIISGTVLALGAKFSLEQWKQLVIGGRQFLAIVLIGSVVILLVSLTTFGARNFFKITGSIEDICISLQNDPQITIDNYSGKFYTVVGPISGTDSYYRTVTIFSGPANVLVYPNDREVSNFKVNQIVQAVGIMVAPMGYPRGGSCKLTLQNATVKYK
ncbi:MAG: hypothetical protein LBF16_09925 [Pseudomonadales bacterium]|jgi:hypothetical protein|nr:hypothetical protein [Pseudomonadales bacterium]